MLFVNVLPLGFFILYISLIPAETLTESSAGSSGKSSFSKTGYQPTIRNLNFTAEVKVSKKDPGQKFISVTIYWEYTSNQTVNDNFVLMVEPENLDKCSKHFASITKLFNGSVTNLTIPENDNYYLYMKHQFVINCSYYIKIEGDLGIVLKKTITIPADVYKCSSFGSIPSIQNVIVKSINTTSRRIKLSWSYDDNSNRTISFKISSSKVVFTQKVFQKNPAEAVYVNYTAPGIQQVNLSLSSDREQIIHITPIMKIDGHECESKVDKKVTIECAFNGKCFCKANLAANISDFEVLKSENSTPVASFSYPSKHLPNVNYFEITFNNGIQQTIAKNGLIYGEIMQINWTIPCSSYEHIYLANIRAIDRNYCYGPPTANVSINCGATVITIEQSDSSNLLSLGITVTVIILVVVFCIFLFRKKLNKWLMSKLKPHTTMTSPQSIKLERNPIYLKPEIEDAILKGLADKFEIALDQLVIGREIGKGAFGRVYVATAEAIGGKAGIVTVAVKQLKEDASDGEKEDFLAEIKMMKQVGRHPHIVTMLACCTIQQPYCMVMEYVPHGDLLRYLRRLRQTYKRRSKIFCSVESSNLSSFQPPTSSNLNENSSFSLNTQTTLSTTDGSEPISPSITIPFNSNNDDPLKLTIPTPSYNQPIRKNGFNHPSFSLNYDQNNGSSEYLLRSQSSYGTNTTGYSDTFAIAEETEEVEEDNEAVPKESDALMQERQPVTCQGDYVKSYVRLGTSSPIPEPETKPKNTSSDLHCLTSELLIMFALQIARGMNHLASKGITHRDLAARNVLIDEHKTLKISDFGLSRPGVYVTKSEKAVPLRWLAIEAIKDSCYSTQTDVWAFGVVLWEICTLGSMPYASIPDSNLLYHLLRGNRLEKPENCALEFYLVMQLCWNDDPNLRPTFQDLCDTLDKMKEEPHIYVNFDIETNQPLPPTKVSFAGLKPPGKAKQTEETIV